MSFDFIDRKFGQKKIHDDLPAMGRQARIDAAIDACTECNRQGFRSCPDCYGCVAAVDEMIAAEAAEFLARVRG